MVNIKLFLIVVLVLPAIILAKTSTSAPSCSVSVTATKQDSSSTRYDTYSATALNSGSAAVSNVVLTPSTTLKSLDGLSASGSAYGVASLAAGASATFTFRVKSGSSVRWTSVCASSVAPPAATTTPKASTSAPQASTAAPKAPTAAPKASTGASTTKPAGGRICPTGSWWAPSPLTTWQWQLTGTVDTTKNVQMYDIDLFDATPALISTLHSQGKAVICYFSTQYENWRPDASSFSAAVIGSKLDGWAGENYVDIRSTVVRNVMNSRMDLAVSKGCDGVEPDNVDGFTASTGFPITAANQIDFNTYLANQAHARGLSVGLKNDGDQARTLQPVFDWALNEQCYQYKECDALSVFVQAGKAVFNTEYSGAGATVCPAMNTLKFSSLIKSLDLDASIKAQCCTYSNCNPAPYTCKTASSTRDVRSVDAENNNNIEDATQQEFYASASTTHVSLLLVAVVLAALNF